jgi:hypothetical protein
MAKETSQHQQGHSTGKRSGAGQSIVELCAVSACGLVFWSRQRFDIGSELQIRVKRDAIPTLSQKPQGNEEWISLTGFVVECPAMRRTNGQHGFQVSLLLESAFTMTAAQSIKSPLICPKMKTGFPGLKRAGLN